MTFIPLFALVLGGSNVSALILDPKDSSALATHDAIRLRAYPRSVRPSGAPEPLFKDYLAKPERNVIDHPLVLTSVRAEVDWTKADPFLASMRMNWATLAASYFEGQVRRTIRRSLNPPGQPVSYLGSALESPLIRRAGFDHDRRDVTYRGPIAAQLLSRVALAPATRSGRGPAIHHQTVAYLGFTLGWWSDGTPHGERRRVLRTFDTRDLEVDVRSKDNGFYPVLRPDLEAQIIEGLRQTIEAESTTQDGAPIRISLRRFNPKIEVDLLDSNFSTIVRYPLAREITHAWIKRAAKEAGHVSSWRLSCRRWLY